MQVNGIVLTGTCNFIKNVDEKYKCKYILEEGKRKFLYGLQAKTFLCYNGYLRLQGKKPL